MKDAREKHKAFFSKKGPLRVMGLGTLWSFFNFYKLITRLIAVITSIAFLVTSLPADFAWAAGTPSGLTRVGSDRAGGPGLLKELNVKTFNLPAYLGRVKDSWSPCPDRFTIHDARSTILHIQDAHCNYAAQRKIADIIEYLDNCSFQLI